MSWKPGGPRRGTTPKVELSLDQDLLSDQFDQKSGIRDSPSNTEYTYALTESMVDQSTTAGGTEMSAQFSSRLERARRKSVMAKEAAAGGSSQGKGARDYR